MQASLSYPSKVAHIAAEALHLFHYGLLPEVEADPVQASLWAAAAACIKYATGEWWGSSIVACAHTFAVVDSYLYNDEASEEMDPESAANLLLLVREAEAHLTPLH